MDRGYPRDGEDAGASAPLPILVTADMRERSLLVRLGELNDNYEIVPPINLDHNVCPFQVMCEISRGQLAVVHSWQ